MGENLSNIFLVFTPNVGVKHFWVDLNGMTCFYTYHYYRKLNTAGSRTPITDGFGPRWCMSAVIGDLYLRWLCAGGDVMLPLSFRRIIGQ